LLAPGPSARFLPGSVWLWRLLRTLACVFVRCLSVCVLCVSQAGCARRGGPLLCAFQPVRSGSGRRHMRKAIALHRVALFRTIWCWCCRACVKASAQSASGSSRPRALLAVVCSVSKSAFPVRSNTGFFVDGTNSVPVEGAPISFAVFQPALLAFGCRAPPDAARAVCEREKRASAVLSAGVNHAT
jgi:hypothetical protein